MIYCVIKQEDILRFSQRDWRTCFGSRHNTC